MRTPDRGLPMAWVQEGLPHQVRIYEVGPRDGLQAEAAIIPVEVKAEFVHRLVAAGLPAVELASFVSPKRVPQMADGADLLSRIDLTSGVRHPVLVPNRRGLDEAIAAGAREVAVFASVTESFSVANLGAFRAEVSIEQSAVVRRALEAGLPVRGYLSMVFGDPWEGPVEIDEVVRAAVRLREMGAHSVSLGDTIGVATPEHVKAVVRRLVQDGIEVYRIALHPHDTYGQALANVYAALEVGVSEFDSSSGGLGGCPFALSATGNLATEDLVWMLRGLGIETGVDLYALVKPASGLPSTSDVTALHGSWRHSTTDRRFTHVQTY